MNKKIIVFCTDSLNIGGIEKALLSLLNALKKEDKYIIKLCIKDYEKNYLEEFIPDGIEYIYLTRSKREKYMLHILEKKYEFNKFKKFIEDADIIIDYYDGNFNKYFSKIKDKKKIVFFHTILEKLHIYKNKNINKILTEIYDKYVVLTEGAKEELIQSGVKKNKVEKIYNIIDFEKIRELAIDEEDITDEEMKLQKEEYYISVGRIVNDSKDYETIIKAFEETSEKLYILGDGEYKKELEEIIVKKKMTDRIILLGRKKNPYPWIKNSKGLILSSRYEGLPTVILEAFALNKYVVSSNCPYGPKEILENNRYGDLFDIGDFEKLKEKILNEKKVYDTSLKIKEFTSKEVLKKIDELFKF